MKIGKIKKTKMLNIKDWLKAKHKAQFEFLDVETGSGNSAKRKASRIIDGRFSVYLI